MKQQLIVAYIVVCLLTTLFAKTERDYSDNTVLVVLTPETSNPTQTLPLGYFQGIEITQVENISLIHNEKAIEALKERGSQYRAIYKLTLTTNDKAKVLEVIQQLTKIPGIESASPDYHLTLDLIPNDSEYIYQWGLNTTYGIQAPQAWDITTGSQNVLVGIIDTGIGNHPDLQANLTTGHDFQYNTTATTDDRHGHGTHIAGIIGATTDNEVGVAGINWNVTLVPLQVSNNGGFIVSLSYVVSAINFATDNWGTDFQISVLNHSISGYGEDQDDPRLVAINNYPGLFVWSAGNGGDDVIGDDVDTLTMYIENYNLSNIIAVGAIESVGIRSPFSNYSSSGDFVHIYAPGSDILSTITNHHYEVVNGQAIDVFEYDYVAWLGTSMAAAYVSGVAALLLSANPTLTASQIKQLIVNGADPLTISTSYGQQVVNRLNAHQSVQLATSLSNIALSPSSFDFGTIEVNETSPSQDFTITIQGNGSYTIGSIAITGPCESEFDISVAGLPWHLNTGDSATFTASFSPIFAGVKNASIKIYSSTNELLGIIDLSGAGLVQNAYTPYTQGFEYLFNLSDINWGGDFHSNSRVIANCGVNFSNGLALGVDATFPTQDVNTPAFTGISSQTILSFAYRFNIWSYENGLEPLEYSLTAGDRAFIEASITGRSGPYTVIYEINSTNHTTFLSRPFQLVEIPLATYNGQDVNIRFRVLTGNTANSWYFILDDVAIHNFPAPRSVTAQRNVNNITLHWAPPNNIEDLQGYEIYRGSTLIADVPTLPLSHTDENLLQGAYLYSVRAVYNQGVSNRRSILVDVPNVRFMPYIQDFNQGDSMTNIGWEENAPYYAITPICGVDNTNGLLLARYVYEHSGTIGQPQVVTPTIVGITQEATLSFAYKIVNYPDFWSEYPVSLPIDNFVNIQASSRHPDGYTTLYEINQSNHIPSTSFTTLSIPLTEYSGQDVNILFTMRNKWDDPPWCLVIDNVMITDSIVQGPPRNLVALSGDNNVELTWQAPASAIPLGYKVYRGGVAISGLLTDCAYYDGAVINGNEYTYYVTAVYTQTVELASETVTVQLLSESDEVVVPLVTGLGGNYPNPFNPETLIRFSLARECPMVIEVYNLKGQRVRALVNDVFGAGVHNVVWNGFSDDGRQVGSGVYFYRMVAGEYVGVRKMVLLK